MPDRQRDSNLSPLKEYSRLSNTKSANANLGSGSRVMKRIRANKEKFTTDDNHIEMSLQ